MDEILALQQELAAVQEQDTVHRLSERNCIEILMKLVELDLVKVVYTCNAKEFLTLKQLKLEIQDELLSAGGRMALADIQPIINVDIFHIEKAAAEIVENVQTILLINGELISSWHLDSLVEEVNQILQDTGKIAIANLAAQFNLPVPVIDTVIKGRLGTLLRAKLKNGVLYTEAFDKTQMARIRGICSAVTRPVSIPELVAIYEFDEAVVDEVMNALIKSGQLAGTLRGREYVPTAFSRTQRDCIDAFFAQNGYIEASRAQKLKIHRPLEYVRQSFPDAISLEKLVLSASVLKDLEANLDEAIHNRTWVDVLQVLPPILSTAEGASLLTQSSLVGRSSDRSMLALASTFAVSKAFLQDVTKRFEIPATKRAEEVATQRRKGVMGGITGSESGGNASGLVPAAAGQGAAEGEGQGDIDDSGGSRRGSKKKASKKGGIDEEDDELEPSRGKGKRGKAVAGGGGGGSKKGGKKSSSSGGSGKISGGGDSSSSSKAITEKEVMTLLFEWFPEMEDCPDLVKAIAEEVLFDVTKLYETAIATSCSSITHGDAAARRKEQKAFEVQLEVSSTALQLIARGLEVLPLSDEDSQAISTFILKSRAAQLADLISSFAAGLHDVSYSVASSATAFQPAITLEQRNLLKQQLPRPLGEPIGKLWTLALKGRQSLTDYLDCLELQVIPAMDAVYRKLDKKKEKAMVFNRRMELLAQMQASESPSEMLTVAYQLCLIQGKSAVLFLSPEDAEQAKEAGITTVLSRLLKAWNDQTAEKDHLDADALRKIQALEEVLEAYEATPSQDHDRRTALASQLLQAQAVIKISFGRKSSSTSTNSTN